MPIRAETTRSAGPFLSFQWDILLLEMGFLAIFYAPLGAVSPRSPAWSVAPPRPVAWLLRLLVFKLMFSSGVVKLSSGDPTWWNLTALAVHYETTCLPTWTGWYMHQLPMWCHKVSAGLMFVTELVLPFFVFGPRMVRIVAADRYGSNNDLTAVSTASALSSIIISAKNGLCFAVNALRMGCA
jgi:hypothetical protein